MASYRCFAGTRDAIDVRLVVRRVRPTPGSQLALFTAWDDHAFVTDRPGELVEIEADHRRHAAVEQSIAEFEVGRPGSPALGKVHGERRLMRG
jgi:hypothetical protein